MTIRELTVYDIYKLRLKESWMYDRYRYYIENKTGPAYIIEDNGVPLAAFGAVFEWNWSGACEVWFNFISSVKSMAVVKMLKRLIPELARTFKISRMQALIDCQSKCNRRFIEFLGFRNETPFGMKNKLPDSNAYLYSRIF